MKLQGILAELVTEFAKERVWAGESEALACQPYISGVQFYRQWLVDGKVRFAITDSPLLLGAVYGGFGVTSDYREALVQQFNLFDNINIYIERSESHPYEPQGRLGTAEDAKNIDLSVKQFLDYTEIPYHTIKMAGDGSHIQEIYDLCLILTNSTS